MGPVSFSLHATLEGELALALNRGEKSTFRAFNPNETNMLPLMF